MMLRLPFLKQLAMAGTVLATIIAVVASVQGQAQGAGMQGQSRRGMLASPISAVPRSPRATASAWPITWGNYLAIGWLIGGLIGIRPKRKVAPVHNGESRHLPPVPRHEIRFIGHTLLRAQMPPPCC